MIIRRYILTEHLPMAKLFSIVSWGVHFVPTCFKNIFFKTILNHNSKPIFDFQWFSYKTKNIYMQYIYIYMHTGIYLKQSLNNIHNLKKLCVDCVVICGITYSALHYYWLTSLRCVKNRKKYFFFCRSILSY